MPSRNHPRRSPFLAVALLGLLASSAMAQAPGPDGKSGPSGRSKVSSRKYSPGASAPAPAVPAASPSAPAAAKGPGAAAPAVPKAASPGSPAAAPAAPATTPAAGEKDFLGSLVDFLVGNAVWVVLAIAAMLGLVLWFSVRGSKSKEDSHPQEPAARPAPLARAKKVEEDEGPRRVLVTPASGTPKTAAKPVAPGEEKDYALVVNEEDLKMPPLPQEGAPARQKVDSAALQEMISQKKFDDAYRQYVERIETDGKSEFNPEMERNLGGHFLRSGDLEKAARILEHHVATHHGQEVVPETYFDLAYIHFRSKTINKSRRYFRLFAEHHKDPSQVARAKKLLDRLERVQNLN